MIKRVNNIRAYLLTEGPVAGRRASGAEPSDDHVASTCRQPACQRQAGGVRPQAVFARPACVEKPNASEWQNADTRGMTSWPITFRLISRRSATRDSRP